MKVFHREIETCWQCPMFENIHSPFTSGELYALERLGLEGIDYMKARMAISRNAMIDQLCKMSGDAPPGRIIREVLDRECDSPFPIPDWCPLPDVQ